MKRRHRSDSATFEELTFAGQAKSITAQINVLQRAIFQHVSISKTQVETKKVCYKQINRLMGRLLERL
ncbi:MAG: hypothetical protein ACD_79C00224G0003 [uncultured bacterium]|nr:MAG: hypothetical protein ACD_79C00224G0003 [uncultured bacterium]